MKLNIKLGVVMIMIVAATTTVSCEKIGKNEEGKIVIKRDTKNKQYKKTVVKLLEEKYGEPFEIKQEGGTFAATESSTVKFVCNPVSDPDKFCFVRLEKDLSGIKDDYINRIMEKKLEEYLTPKAKEIFGEEVILKPFIGGVGAQNKYTSLDMDVVDFMKLNKGEGYSIDIFVKSDGNIDKDKEAKSIDNLINNIVSQNVMDSATFVAWYVNSTTYYDVTNKIYKLAFEEEEFEYYTDKSKTYTSSTGTIDKGVSSYSIENIRKTFDKFDEKERENMEGK